MPGIDGIGQLCRLYNLLLVVDAEVGLMVEHAHEVQSAYPLLDSPVALPAEGDAWVWGALTTIVPINTIGTDYQLHSLSISAMSANASFAIRLSYGADDTLFAYAILTRGGVQIASVVIPVQGPIVPANSIFTAQLADSIGTSTLAMKIAYHAHAH